MISRRNIRVKVMQTLYAMETMDPQTIKPGAAHQSLTDNLEQATQVFTYLLYNITQIAQYAEIDAQQRSSKHLPTEEDLHVNTKIAGNLALYEILQEPGFQAKLEADKLKSLIDREIIKKIYHELTGTEAYRHYILDNEREPRQEKKILEFILDQLLLKSELFDQHMEDLFLHWDDDKEIMPQLIGNYFAKPQLFNFQQLISKEKVDYAHELLQTVCDKKEYCQQLIKPKLQNWDPERIATIDMLLMEMGICEFLYFPTIPTKVTINEYIDLAKSYSTPQSGQFVNGILDNILKELEAENKISKTERARN